MTEQERNNALFTVDAIRQVFGINSPIFIPWGDRTYYEAAGFQGMQLLPEDAPAVYSEFGTPVFGTVTFEAGEYNSYNRMTGALEKVAMETYTLPHSCIVTYSRDANITKTEVLGSTGTVKELYGKGDWNITIRGIAFSNRNGSGLPAQEQINRLIKWDNLCDSIPVVGNIFREKGINNIVIETMSIQPVVGRRDAIPFQIEAISDEPVELYLL
jgi:hypothetical protein